MLSQPKIGNHQGPGDNPFFLLGQVSEDCSLPQDRSGSIVYLDIRCLLYSKLIFKMRGCVNI